MARIRIFSDSHGNGAGMVATLQHARDHGCTEFICLGDVADGGDEGELCVRLLRENRIPTVRGNHDEYGLSHLSEDAFKWMKALPSELRRGDIMFTHIAPAGENENRIQSTYRACSVFEKYKDFRILMVGHLHYPVFFGEKSEDPGQAALPAWKYGVECFLKPDDRYIMCPGSIGYPRDGMRQLRYLIYDSNKDSITFMRFVGPLLDFGN